MSSKDLPPNQTGTADIQQILQQCNQLAQRREYREALSTCRDHLARNPDNPDLLNLAGTLAFQDGQLREAEVYFRQAIRLTPRRPLLYVNLANTLNKSGRTDEAITACNTALSLAPANAEILSELASLYVRRGDTPAAAQTYERLLSHKPGHPAALDYLEPFYQNALKNNPDRAVYLKNLGTVLMQKGKLEEARESYIRAHELLPNDIDVMINLAHTFYWTGETANAEALYREALRLNPEHADLHHSLGVILNNLGRAGEAIGHFRNALRITPTRTDTHRQLAYVKKHEEYDDDIRLMEQVLERPTLNILQKSQLNFGLGKAYEDLQEYDRAFTHYAAANDLKRGTLKYDITGDRQYIEKIMQTFNAKLFTRLKNCGYSSRRPIFIIGMPRSGTTLVEQILSSHPDVYGAGEIEHFGRSVREYYASTLNSRYPLRTEKVGCEDLAELGMKYCQKLSQYDSSAHHVTNKMPHNFLYAGMIRLTLPDAKIIHCSRNPLDTCLSCYTINFSKGLNFAYTLDELGKYYRLYARLMQHWRNIDDIGIIDVSYEDLVNDQENQTRRLLDACGLEWDDVCLEFHKSDRPVMTASVNQVRRGLYNKSVERWKHFEAYLTPLIDSLGDALYPQNNGE